MPSITAIAVWLSACAFQIVALENLQQPFPIDEPASSATSPFSPDFDALVNEMSRHYHVPGLSIAVIDGNKTYSKGYGLSSLEPPVAATPLTLYYGGSTTKSFTAAVLSLLIDPSASSNASLTRISQKFPSLSWTTPISSLIRSAFVLPDPYATSHVTLEDAASHRTGMPRHDSSYGGPGYETKEKFVSKLRYLPMTAEPRTRWQYCNMMYTALSHVIGTLAAADLGDVLRDWVWKPLNMEHTFFNIADALRATKRDWNVHMAVSYHWDTVKNTSIPEQYFSGQLLSGAGDVISNVLDYTLWLRAMMDQTGPISKAQHAELRKPRSFAQLEDRPDSSPQLYALGWFVSQYRGQAIVYHGGSLAGFSTQMLYMPWRKWGFVVFANAEGALYANQVLQYKLLDDLLQTPQEERIDWQARGDSRIAGQARELGTGRERLYPKAPTPKIPLSLSLEEYEGLYFHPAYNLLNITLVIPNSRLPLLESPELVLHADAQYKTLPEVYDFEHVSGEYFLFYTSFAFAKRDLVLNSVTKAEFRLNEGGFVSEVGIAIEPEMKEEMIWFKRTT